MTDGFGPTASRDELAKIPARPVMPRTDAGWWWCRGRRLQRKDDDNEQHYHRVSEPADRRGKI